MHRTLSPLLLFMACTGWTPPDREPTPGGSGITFPEPTSTGDTGWALPERGPPDVLPPTPTTAPGPGTTGPAGSSGGPDEPEPGTTGGALVDLAALQIAEVLPDPAGKDGGASSPEFVEILHVGQQGTVLAGLEIVARAWPVLDAEELGITDVALQPGQRLVVLRFAAAADLPDPVLVVDERGVTVAFAHEDGLRNADGGVLLRAGGVVGDLVIFGAAQPAPWDSPGAWTGPAAAAPGSGMSLCRVGGEDLDAADDFVVCSPSPGEAGVSDDTSTGDATTTGTTGDAETTAEALPAEVVIVEVLSNPVGPGPGEKADEFVELINLGPGTIDLAGWTIADALADDAAGVDPLLYLAGDGGCAPATCLAVGARAIVVGGAYSGPTGAGLVLVTDDTTLANAGLAVHEPVVVRDADGLVRSTYRAWQDPLAAPDPAATEQALVRDPAAVDAPESWSFAAPSPGS